MAVLERNPENAGGLRGLTRKPDRSGRHSLRVIAGDWRSRRIQFADSGRLRPTGDRVRETLFNWIGTRISRSHCLDLFAGSGVLGIEALSRGAASATFIESDRTHARWIESNLTTLGAGSRATLIVAEALSWLASGSRTSAKFDFVFVDPPFDSAAYAAILEHLNRCGHLSDGAQVYLETRREQNINTLLPDGWAIKRVRDAARVRFALLTTDEPARDRP